MNEIRISKYDPKFRYNGNYMLDEWTDFSDIGKHFADGTLTPEKYLIVENNYISAILDIMIESGIKSVIIGSFEQYSDTEWTNGQTVTIKQLSDVIRDCLRNNCWCMLESEKFYIHFGYDFYVYIGCAISFIRVKQICEKRGLFVDNTKSPYKTTYLKR